MDTVADAVLEAHKMAENGDFSPQSIDHLENEIALTLVPALVLFFAAGGGLGLVIYFFVNLSDCQEDLINPYTLCERVNTKLHWELIAHGAAVGALLLEELVDGDRLHWVALLLATPGLALRCMWWQHGKLKVDATSVFHSRFAGQLKTRWGLMCLWHGVTLLFAFVQLVMHMVLGLHRSLPSTMQTVGDAHLKRAQLGGGLGGMAGLHPGMHHMMNHL